MAAKKNFDFKLGDKLKITRSNEVGIVFGRSHFVDSNPQYWVKYVDALGKAEEGWFGETELELVESAAEQPAAA